MRPIGRMTMKVYGIAAALGVAAMVAGCATQPETHVTRFSLGGPIARGQITVEPLIPADRGTPQFATYADIVARQLAQTGFNEVPNLATSEQVAVIAVDFGSNVAPPRGGLTIGIGGGSVGYHGGIGGGVSVPVTGTRGREIAAMRLTVQIRRRSDHSTIWEGRAETSAPAGSPAAQPAVAVQRLADAMFKGFPGESGRTITVK